MELSAIITQLRGQRGATNVMMGSVWREEGQQCADRMAAGIPFQTAGHEQAIILNGLQDVHLQMYMYTIMVH